MKLVYFENRLHVRGLFYFDINGVGHLESFFCMLLIISVCINFLSDISVLAEYSEQNLS